MMHKDSRNDRPGTVVSVGHGGVQIKWDSGKVATYSHNGMEKIRVAK